MQSTTALLILNMVPSVLSDEAERQRLTPKIAQLIQHFKLYEQPICALDPHAPDAAMPLVEGLQHSSDAMWRIPITLDHPFDAPAFQAWFSLQSQEQDYLMVGVHSDRTVIQLAQALHEHITQTHSDQAVYVVIDATGPIHPPPEEVLRQLGVQLIHTDDFINA